MPNDLLLKHSLPMDNPTVSPTCPFCLREYDKACDIRSLPVF